MSAFDPSAPGLPIVGGGGASLPDTPADVLLDAANAGKIVGLAQGTGEGTAFDPNVVVEAGVGLAAGTTAGATLVGDGTEGAVLTSATISALLASADAAAARTALGITTGLSVTRYYASDFTVENGSDSASKTGTGVSSTATLSTTASSRVYGTSGATAPRIVLPIPANAREITVAIIITSVTNMSTSGFRWLGVALRNAANGGAPARLYGIGISDGITWSPGNLMSGANGGGTTPNGVTSVGLAAARAHRVAIQPLLPRVEYAAVASAAPAGWGFPQQPATVSATNAESVANMDNPTAIAIWLQPFSAGASSITFSVTVDVVTS